MNAPTPPRDALVRDRFGDVWTSPEAGLWTPADTARGIGTYSWTAALAEFGPLDVLVWRHTVHLAGALS